MTGRLLYRVAALGAVAAFAFTAATAQASMLYDQAVLDLDAIGYWKLDGNADDSSGNAHHGSATNITWLTDGPDPAAPGAGRGDGSSGVVHVDNHSDLMPEGPMSVVAWTRRDGASGSTGGSQEMPAIASVNDRGWILRYGGGGWGTGANASGAPRFDGRESDGTVIWDPENDLDDIWDNQWHMIAGVYDRDEQEMRLYVNGELAHTETASGAALASDMTADMTIFASYSDADGGTLQRFLDGDISRVSLHDRVLSDADVANLYAAIPEPGTLGLLAAGSLLLMRRRARRQ